MAEPVVLVSACLLGIPCRYDGGSKLVSGIRAQLAGCRIVPFCPEVLGGLETPRPAAEITGGDGAAVLDGAASVRNRAGLDVTGEFIRGAEAVLDLVRANQPASVILKAKSPSCGVGRIYDGSFTGRLRDGDGVTVALLRRSTAIRFYTEEDFPIQDLDEKNA
ncbi:uncharacterized protein YbbK (DUF523 family) [Hydrogenispora ethanolica]|uniref:Uncharacterized protein YbbK (DUF523 family) n=1 Tax=Hydrogenispora ethanolica TaxID=1082276 RepID=A0A4R1RKK2_HYDET|nr:DUF523 domain-containing protein [Hydrogenispora ethanolica]TCL66586.1 uncharacterized protein YbbK (DUF523 family) [Hydrogenispora ethanolica]